MHTARFKKAAAALIAAGVALASTTAVAGGANGASCSRDIVRANTTDVFRMTFGAGQPASVSIQGDRDTDLDLEVRDDRGNRICLANGPTDRESCEWTPRWTGKYQIRVSNLGGVYNYYRICTN